MTEHKYQPPFVAPEECDHEGADLCSRCCPCQECSDIRKADLVSEEARG